MARTAEDRKRQLVAEFRRGEILDAATRVFGTKGFDGTRVDDIAAEAKLAKATVYAYFDSKDEIYEAAVEQALAEIRLLTEEQVAKAADFPGKLRAFIAVRLSYWHEKQPLYRVISSVNHEMKNRRRRLKWQRVAVDYLLHMFTEAAERGEIPQQDFEAAAWALMDMIRGIHERRIVQQEQSPEEEIRRLTGFTLRALSSKCATSPQS
jgi:AcrR family transcriptional regulator